MPKYICLDSFQNIPDDLLQIKNLSEKTKIEFVQREITLNNIKFTLIDVKLAPWPDEDIVYRDNNIRLLIPRGLCFIFANNIWIHTLYGHPKFGNFGDYLPDNCTTKNMESANNIVKKIFRSKENGECAHWSAFMYNDIIYEIYGSKNVHLIVRSNNWKTDLDLYTDQRYNFALKMARLINSYEKTLAINYLVASTNTLCGEGCFCDSQHFVDYVTDRMFFFAVTGKRYGITNSIVKISPLDIDDFIKSLNLNPVLETICCDRIEDQKEIENYFELANNSEGAVVSYLNANNETIYIHKHKNINYVYERALREQMKNNSNSLKIKERFKNIHIIHPKHNELLNKLLKFNAWYRQSNLSKEERDNFFSNWVNMMKKFESLSPEEQNRFEQIHNIYETQTNALTVFILVGIPGSGKSLLARSIKKIFDINNVSGYHLEQDMFGSNVLYQKAIAEKMENKDINYLILAKSNHNKAVRENTYSTLNKCSRLVKRIYVVMKTHDKNTSTVLNLCIRRILNRGLSHKTLYGKSDQQLKTILSNSFVKEWQDLTGDELSHDIINVNIEQEKLSVIKGVCRDFKEKTKSDDLNVTDQQILGIFNTISLEDIEMSNQNKKK